MGEKVKLGIYERFALTDLLPKLGSMKELEQINLLKRQLKLTLEESKSCELVQLTHTTVDWNHSKEIIVEFDIPANIVDVIVDILVKLDEAHRLETRHMALYKRFVEISV